ncbi:MAG: hypothetical protein R3346_04210 [Candidatus Spechtbacterales bacterium]|nr:hypothetical protein [Candidatus Spechtbacterales bacterium]
MQEEKYNDYTIQSNAYQDEETDKWVPQAKILRADQNEEEYPLTWEREFDTREEAESFAMQSAQFYIENHF